MVKINMKPIARKKTTKQIVYDELKKAIFNGSIGTKMLTETMLSETLETSRTPIREAVADLTKEGLLVHIPRKGFHVRKITEEEKDQIIFLRLSIEAEGLRKLAPRVTEEQIKKMKEIVSEQEQKMIKNDRIEYIECDQVFHRQIIKFANQSLLEQVLQEMYSLTRLVGHNALMKDGRMEEVIHEHNEIIHALQNKDGTEAAKRMKKHLEVTKANVKVVKEE